MGAMRVMMIIELVSVQTLMKLKSSFGGTGPPSFEPVFGDEEDDEMGIYRKCVNCGVIEPLQNQTQMCCRARFGLSCILFGDRIAGPDDGVDPKPGMKTVIASAEATEVEETTDSTMIASGE